MIYLTGDTHGQLNRFSFSNFPDGKTLNKEDYVIILGDFGVPFFNDAHDRYWLKFLKEKPFTTLFIDGNHDNHTILDSLPLVNKFGGIVGQLNDSVFHLKRGEIYTIDNKRIFTFGGAKTFDVEPSRNYLGKLDKGRTEGKNYWKREIFSKEEKNEALINISNGVDIILSHTCPASLIQSFSNKVERIEDPVSIFFDELKTFEFKKWYFGHFHQDIKISDKFECLYKNIIELK